LFHTSLLVDFDIALMTDIMNTPVIKLEDKGYNCFSQRMTTVRDELGRRISVTEMIEAIQNSFEEEFSIRFKEDSPDEWEEKTIQALIEERYTKDDWVFSHKHPRARMGVGQLKTKGGLLEVYLALSGASIESVLVTHTHPDHFDPVAGKTVPKELPVFCQPGDKARLAEAGFKNITPVDTADVWENITISRTGGKHGSGKILERMGIVSGFVLQADGEPTVYWVGDSIWCEDVEDAVEQHNPDIIITHSGGAIIPGHDPIIMDAEQTITLANAYSEAKVVAIHLESLDHCTVSRDHLREMAEKAEIPASRLFIPNDGETLTF